MLKMRAKERENVLLSNYTISTEVPRDLQHTLTKKWKTNL